LKAVIPIILVLISIYCNAQDKIPELVTDRPDQNESSSVVPAKSLQIETGFLTEIYYKDYIKHKSVAYNTTLLRYGRHQNMELRLGLDYLGDKTKITGTDSTITASVFAPLYTGFKIRIMEEEGWKPAIAFLGALGLPYTANDSYKPAHSAANKKENK
jgi:hypothetical protein